MTDRLHILCRLREGVAPEAYERWLTEVDLPAATRLDTVVRYSVARLEPPAAGEQVDLPWHYVETIDVTSAKAHAASAGSDPDFAKLLEEWETFVEAYVVLPGCVLHEVDKG